MRFDIRLGRLLPTLCAALFVAALAAPSAGAFGLLPGDAGFSVTSTEPDGSLADRAGSHPGALTTRVGLDASGGDLRDLEIERPPGMVENPAALETCSLTQFRTPRDSPFQESTSGESCPLTSQVGTLTVALRGGAERTYGVFSLDPPAGAPALLGASPWGMPIRFVPAVRGSSGSYRTMLQVRDLSQQLDVASLELALWGHPWQIGNDDRRGDCLNELDPSDGYGEPATLEKEPQTSPPSPPYYEPGTCSVGNPKAYPVRAYLTMPTSCAAPLESRIALSGWQAPARIERGFTHRDGGGQPLVPSGCNQVEFRTEGVIARPNSDRAASPTGFQFELGVDQQTMLQGTTEAGRLIPQMRAPSQVRSAVVSLPEGMTINPSLAAGLRGCAADQFAAEALGTHEGQGCPNDSKIGEMVVQSPLFERQITGSLYLATPYQNPYGVLVGIYMVARAPERGVMVKLAGKVDPDPADGSLVATFDELPQLPYESLLVRFRDGQRSPIASPPKCGTYSTRIALTPWGAGTQVYEKQDPFALTKGIGGGACPQTPLPFAPNAYSGTSNRHAGFYSPFFLRFTRTDAEQEITSYSTGLPTGLLGNISNIPFCSEAAIAAARVRDGFAEAASPSCPAASRIGRTYSGYGTGSVLAYAEGGLYLAGPYNGSSLSIVAVNPATVGPFDLGVIIVRSAVRIDPITARVWLDSAGSDPIPHIMRGVPIHLRDVRVYVDRPNFTLNPTSCDPGSMPSILTGSGISTANPADDMAVSVANPFQVSFCSSLPFAPRIEFRLKGPVKRGAYPTLRAIVIPRPGDANIGRVVATLPPSQFLAQENIKTICTRQAYALRACPHESVYGWARAETPLMETPLEGPVVLRSSENELPDMVAQLSGRGIDVDVVGRIDAVKGKLRATYDVLPDAPVSRFELTLRGGKKRGLLVNSDNICFSAPATVKLIGQNNIGVIRRPSLVNSACKKKKAGKRKAAKAKKGSSKKAGSGTRGGKG
jgi:hypothetical protein